MQKLLTIEEVAARLTVSVETVRRLIREGKFFEPVHPTDGSAAWQEEDITAYLWPRMNAHRIRKPGAKGKGEESNEEGF